MNRELSKQDVDAQIKEKEKQITDHLKSLENQVRFAGDVAKKRGESLLEQGKEQARKGVVIAGGALVAGLTFAVLFTSRRNVPARKVRQVDVNQDFADGITEAIGLRMSEGQQIREAIRDLFAQDGPIILRPEGTRVTGGGVGGFTGLFLLVGALFGVNYALERFTGKSIIDRLEDLMDEQLRREQMGIGEDSFRPMPGAYAGDEALQPVPIQENRM
jgi:hypothetical protein